jgi:phage shock protein A
MAENKIVQQLEQSVEKLLEQYTLSAEEVARLQMLTAAQQRKIRTLQQQLSDAEKALAQAKLSEAMVSDGGNTKAARAQINRLLREVDKCIELVSAKI